jgi:hypothetical protein
MNTKLVEIECEILHTTYYDYSDDPKSIKINDGKNEAWIPWSLVTDYCEEKGVITSIFIPDWWAIDNGLI